MDILNDILSALSFGLASLYPDIPVCSEPVQGQLSASCFFIGFAGECSIRQEIGGRYAVSGTLNIAYLTPQNGEEQRHELNAVFARLALNLKTIRYCDLNLQLRGHTWREADGVLHDHCKFQTFLFLADDTPIMQDISVDREELKQ